MTTLTPAEEAILRPEYLEYIQDCILLHQPPLNFNDWWRAMADNAKEEGKYNV